VSDHEAIDPDGDDLYDDDEIDLHGTNLLARAGGVGAKLRIKSNFDVKWFAIALEHEIAALEARDRAEAAPEGSPELGAAFDAELRAGMVALAAAAFAIDALYTKLSDMLDPDDRVRARDRAGYVVETLKTALDIGKLGQAWQTSIPALFDERDALVHLRGDLHRAGLHPTGKAYVSHETVRYTVESTSNAIDLALEVLTTAYRSPRSNRRAIPRWSENNAHVPQQLEAARAAVHETR
jgi:hypothetical protein